MCLMWLFGVAGMMSGCQEIDYLRGSHDMTSQLARDADAAEHPVARSLVVRERAWIEALGHHHRRAFPIAALRMLVAVVLIVGSGGALVGRPRSRGLALQAIAANAAVAAVSFVLLAPVRYATAHAVATDAVENVVGVPEGITPTQRLSEQHTIAMQREHSMAMLEIALFGAAAIALTRKRTKGYFAAIEETIADAQS